MTGVILQRAVIANGATDSEEVDLLGRTLTGVHIPSGFTGSSITIKAIDADGNENVVADGAGNDLSKTVAASKYIPLNPTDMCGIGKIKIVSGSSEGAARTLFLALREID